MSWAYDDTGLTLSLSPETLARAITEILEGVVRNGIRRVLVVNGHDGNIASIELAARNLRRFQGITVAALEAWWMVLDKVVEEGVFTPGSAGHGGEPETALTMVAAPDLVRLELARPPAVPPDMRHTAALTGVRVYSIASEHHANNEFLDARGATAAAGERALEGLVQHMVDFLEHADRVDWKFGVQQGGEPRR
jgi:creatinine amidohydrolase